MSLITMKNVSKSYGTKKVLDQIGFAIEEGKVTAIIGPNGTGKTTLMEIMMTLRKADEGEICILGKNLSHEASVDFVRSQIGAVFQEGGMYPYIKLKEALDLFASFYQIERAEVEKVVEEFELQPYLSTKYQKMSGGWKQRFLLAISFLPKPQLIFLDEPTTGLDPKAAKILWNKIKGERQDNKTIVLTTHSMEEVEKFCDYVIVLSEGHVIAEGTPKNLKKEYQKDFFSDVYFQLVEGGL